MLAIVPAMIPKPLATAGTCSACSRVQVRAKDPQPKGAEMLSGAKPAKTSTDGC